MRRLWDAIWYNGGRGPSDGNPYWRRVTAGHYVWVGLCLTAMCLLSGSLALVVGAVHPGNVDPELQWSYFSELRILVLNLLPGLLLTALFYFATGRAWAGFLGGALVPLALSLVNFYKVIIRGEIFTPGDIALVGEAAGVISGYKIVISGRAVATIGALVLGTAFSLLLLRGRIRNVWVRVIGALVSLGVLVTVLFTVYFNDDLYNDTTNETAEYNIWAEQQVYISKGFLYSFLHGVPDAFPQAPEGYDQRQAEEMLARYQDEPMDPAKRVNVVAVMLEAYCDLTEFPELTVMEDVYAPLHAIQAESLHGHLISNVFGGGTVNTERAFLTGYVRPEEYRTATDSFVWFLRENGYRAEGMHPGDSWYYNRENVEINLGLERYLFLEDYQDASRSDEFLFRHLKELIDGRDAAAPYFNFSVSYQNHGGYAETPYTDGIFLKRGDLDEGSFNIINNYLSGIADTNERLLDMVNWLRDKPEPFVLVFFGDHKPYLSYAYEHAGIDMDYTNPEGFYNYYATPYVIWANDAAKAVTGGSFTGQGEDLSACFLMDRLFDECGWGESAYMQLTHEVRQRVNAVNTGSSSWLVEGVLTHELTPEDAELVRRLEWCAYCMAHRFTHAGLTGG